MENIDWPDSETKIGVLKRAKKKKKILHTIKGRKATWMFHILRRNCLLKHVIEGNIEGTGRRGRRRTQLLGDLKEMITR